MARPRARVCRKCGRPMGCFSFAYTEAGRAKRDYFHPDCFRDFKAEIINREKGN